MNKSKTEILANFVSRLFSFFPKGIKRWAFARCRKKSGRLGFIFRSALIKSLSKKCGMNLLVFPDVYISHLDSISIGDNVSIHPMCYIDGAGGLSIGNNVSIAHGVTIMTTEHRYEDLSIPIRNQGWDFESTTIADNVWIGAKATILAGNDISSGVVIGANAVITKNCHPNAIMVGVPAKAIKYRK